MDWESVGSWNWRQEISSWDSSNDPPSPLWTVYIQGPAGTIAAKGIVWMTGREDMLDGLYWEIVAVLD